jgi:transcriptional regulator with XRE-family HTH domain
MTTFGDRLRQLRREAGLSQTELAGTELSASYVSLLEAGKRTPSGEVVNQLAVRLGCSTTQLLEGRESERDQRIALEIAYARLAVTHGEAADARDRLARLIREDGLPIRSRDEITMLLGRATELTGEHVTAIQIFLPLLDRAERGDTHIPACELANTISHCYLQTGDTNQAAVIGERGLTAATARGLVGSADYFKLAASVMLAYTQLGDFVHARMWADRVITHAESAGQPLGQAAIYWNSALIAEYEGRIDEALHLCERAMGHFSELDDARNYARLLVAVGQIHLAGDPPQPDRAADLLTRAENDIRDLGSRDDVAEWSYTRSTVQLYLGELDGAQEAARAAITLLSTTEASAMKAAAFITLGDALAAMNQDEHSVEAWRQAFAQLELAGVSRVLSLQWRELAERLFDAGELERAVQSYRCALDGAGVRDRSRAVRQKITELRSASERASLTSH